MFHWINKQPLKGSLMADFNLCSAGSSATMVEGLLMPISGSVFKEKKQRNRKKGIKLGQSSALMQLSQDSELKVL